MKRLLLFALFGLAATTVHAELVVLKSGLIFEGAISEKGDKVEVRTDTAVLTLDKKEIVRTVKDVNELLKEAEDKRKEARKLFEETRVMGAQMAANEKLDKAISLLLDCYEVYWNARRALTAKRYDFLGPELASIRQELSRYRNAKIRVIGVQAPEDVYEEKSRAAGKDAEARYQLALWCEKQKNMRDLAHEEFARTVELDPNHERARDKLGYVRRGEKWITKEENMQLEAAGKDVIKPPAGATPVTKTVKELLVDLKSTDEKTRVRAVHDLVKIGTEPACDAVARRWKSEVKGSAVYSAIQAALTKFRPKDVAGELESFVDSKECGDALLLDCVDVLEQLGGTDCARALAKYFASNREAVRTAAASALKTLGDASVPHLAKMMKVEARRGEVIDLLAEIGTQKAAAVLVVYLDHDHKHTPLGQAVNGALKKIGKPAVPALIDALDCPGRKLWAAYLLREITGEPWGSADKGKWIQWWKLNKDKK